MKTNYENTSMLDIVFENRNKAYGAYILRQQHDRTHLRAVIIMLSVISVVFLGSFIKHLFSKSKPNAYTETVLHVQDVKLAEEVKKEPKIEEAKKQEQPKAKATDENREKKVVAQSAAPQDTILTNEQIKAESGLTTNHDAAIDGKGVTDGKGTGDQIFEVIKPVADAAPLRFVEEMPEYPGGEKALLRFLAQNTEYPEREKELGIGGNVVSEFTVNEDGHISDLKVVKSPSSGFDREVARVVKMLKPFKPGKQQGRAVKVRYVLPFKFHQTND